MAIEYFLKLDGIPGESLAAKHTGEIELHSWSWGAHNHVNVEGSGMSAGKVSISEMSISKPVDKASAKLLELCCNGKHIASGLLSCAKSTGDKNPSDYLTIKLEEVYIGSFQSAGSAGDSTGSESVSLAFAKFTYDYKIQGKDGTLTAAGTAVYDQTKREVG
jgi:type VI secretion system secreted protein Hcp